MLTKGYGLPARYVIHAVGPVWRDGTSGEQRLLEQAYESAFQRARDARDVRTIAFPAISTGVYGYPKRDAAQTAMTVMRRHEAAFDEIVACLFDDESFVLYDALLKPAPEAR